MSIRTLNLPVDVTLCGDGSPATWADPHRRDRWVAASVVAYRPVTHRHPRRGEVTGRAYWDVLATDGATYRLRHDVDTASWLLLHRSRGAEPEAMKPLESQS